MWPPCLLDVASRSLNHEAKSGVSMKGGSRADENEGERRTENCERRTCTSPGTGDMEDGGTIGSASI